MKNILMGKLCFKKALKQYAMERVYAWSLWDINPDTGKKTCIFFVHRNYTKDSYINGEDHKVYDIIEEFNNHHYFLQIHEKLMDYTYSYESFIKARELCASHPNLKLEIIPKVKDL